MAYQIPAFNQPPRQDVNVNPLDAELAADPTAMVVWRRARGSINTIVTAAHARITEITNGLAAQLYQIEADDTRTQAYRAQATALARNAASEQIEALKATCEQARATVRAVIAGELDVSGLSNSVSDIEHTRDAWERVKMQMGAPGMLVAGYRIAPDPYERLKQIAKDAAERGDTYMMAAIRQNGESFLIGEGKRFVHAQFVAEMNAAMGAAATPSMRAAMQIEQALEMSWPNIQTALSMALNYCRAQLPLSVTGLPGWLGLPGISIG